ncbi:MAG: nicotinate-nucleotide adenylyltransferase [Thermotogota bacterium]
MKGRVGLLGGTFDPPHNAHLAVAKVALRQFELSRIVFVPNGIPPQKSVSDGVTSEDRYRMACQAITGCRQFSVSRVEIDRDGPSYTIDTIRAMKEDCPEGVCFILGADQMSEIETWREPRALLDSVSFVVAPRAGISLSFLARPPFDVASVHVLDMGEVDLSSTAVRDRVARGESIEAWVPRSVARYIEEHGLYRVGAVVRSHGTGGQDR